MTILYLQKNKTNSLAEFCSSVGFDILEREARKFFRNLPSLNRWKTILQIKNSKNYCPSDTPYLLLNEYSSGETITV